MEKLDEEISKILAIETISPDDDIVTSIDYSDGTSKDMVSIDKHIYNDDSTLESGFEVYQYNRDGTGDYTPTGDTFKDIEEVRDYINSIIEKIRTQGR